MNDTEMNVDATETPEETAGNPTPEQVENNDLPTEQKEKTFTQEEVNKIVEKRLNRERQRLAGVFNSGDPREAALAERERALTEKELRIDARETFRTEGLPEEVLDLLNYTDKESCDQSVELVRKVFMSNVEEAVNKRLRGEKPLKIAPQEPDIDMMLHDVFRAGAYGRK